MRLKSFFGIIGLLLLVPATSHTRSNVWTDLLAASRHIERNITSIRSHGQLGQSSLAIKESNLRTVQFRLKKGDVLLRITIEKDVLVRMRDGILLSSDIYRPSENDEWPVILVQTPYNKSDPYETNVVTFDPVRAATNGYIVCVQDVRGRYASQGKFHPIQQEVDDGYDAVQWCSNQQWSNGKIGMAGTSYAGATQWLAAISAPPNLLALAQLPGWEA